MTEEELKHILEDDGNYLEDEASLDDTEETGDVKIEDDDEEDDDAESEDEKME